MTQPCPFCGDEHLAVFQIARRVRSSGVTIGVAGSGAFIECGSCGGRGPEAKTGELAWAAWNRRACPAVERLRAELAAAVVAHEESDAAFHAASDEAERLENRLADITAERDRLRAAGLNVVAQLAVAQAERDTTPAVLADTPENVDAVAQIIGGLKSTSRRDARAVLAALRARHEKP